MARVEATASGLTFLDDSRQQKDAYLAQRLRNLSDEDRMVLEQAAEVLERILDDRVIRSTDLRAVGARTFRSLRIRNYRLFFIGQLVSVTGTWMQTVAQTWLVVDLTGSGVDLGITVALQFLPMLLFGMWGGALADRSDKRRLLIGLQAASGILALILYALVATGSVELWMVYVLAFALGVVTAIDMPARQSFVIEMVGPDEIPNAVGLNSAMYNSGRILGPAAAGVTIATLGLAPAFLANALSFVAVIVALVMMRPEELHRREPAERRRGEVRAGLLYAWRDPTLRSTLLLVSVLGMFGFNFIVVLPLLAKFTFGGDAGLYSVFTSLMAFGSLAGALISASRSKPTSRMLIGSGLAFGGLVSSPRWRRRRGWPPSSWWEWAWP